MKITKILASAVITAAVGVNIAFCACANGNDADNERQSITLTADTDFKALVSEKTDNEGWKKAFSPENYYNCTLKNESSQTENLFISIRLWTAVNTANRNLKYIMQSMPITA